MISIETTEFGTALNLQYSAATERQGANIVMSEKNRRDRLVLVVEDEPRILRFLSISLRASGYNVVSTMRGDQAIDLVKSEKPDIIVLDVFLPGADGFEVLKELRTFSQLPVIVMSARDSLGPEALALGATEFVAKPFRPEQLIQGIRNILCE
jgi:two-component system KDP operon response regulator KdpE